MNSVLTVAQIEAQFASEWVLVEDPRPTRRWKCRRGRFAGTARTGTRSIGKRWSFGPNGSRRFIAAPEGDRRRAPARPCGRDDARDSLGWAAAEAV